MIDSRPTNNDNNYYSYYRHAYYYCYRHQDQIKHF